MTLVVDHQPDPATRQHRSDPAGVQRADRGDHHLGLGGRVAIALLDRHQAVFAQRGLDLGAGLLEQLGPVGQDQHRVLGCCGEPGEDHGLAGAGRQADQLPTHPAPPGLDHRLEGSALVRPQDHRLTPDPRSWRALGRGAGPTPPAALTGRMALVAPSILSADFGHLAADVQQVLALGADWIHVDVMDGRFVPNLTIGPVVTRAVRAAAGDATVDVHLMIVEPERYVAAFREAGADVLTVHAEACQHLHRNVQQIKQLGAKAGVSLNPHTPPAVLDYVLDELDLVLVMSVNPGFGGQSLIEAVLPKITTLRQAIDRRGLSTLIEVDGGIKPGNAHRFVEAGAHVLVSGSGVFGAEDRRAAIAALKEA